VLRSRDDLSDKGRRPSKSSLIAYGLSEALRGIVVNRLRLGTKSSLGLDERKLATLYTTINYVALRRAFRSALRGALQKCAQRRFQKCVQRRFTVMRSEALSETLLEPYSIQTRTESKVNMGESPGESLDVI
jgi:hypothetical protein